MIKTTSLNVELGDRSYPIYIGEGLLQKKNCLDQYIKGKQVLIVTNETIAPLYLDNLIAILANDRTVKILVLPDGEKYKNLESIDKIYDALLENNFNRTATLIALGGGVIGDMVGFAAATYQRGINFIQVPTTLLSQVDSSVGGKTGVNHRLGKNMIGAFYQPECVLIDVDVLKTLEDRELSAGIAEVIKYGAICDSGFFDWLEMNMSKLLNRENSALKFAIKTSCQKKAEVVEKDERESGIRATLNFGHTFGHAIEASMGYGIWLHGEGVAVGMCMAASLSNKLGTLTEQESNRIKALCEKAKLPINKPDQMNEVDFMKYMRVDKKNTSDKIKFILLSGIGVAYITDDVSTKMVSNTIKGV